MSDTGNMVVLYAKAQTKCSTVDSINIEPLRVDRDVKGDDRGIVTQGNIDERWTAKLCGQEVPFLVTFIPDGKGGSYYRVRPEKK